MEHAQSRDALVSVHIGTKDFRMQQERTGEVEVWAAGNRGSGPIARLTINMREPGRRAHAYAELDKENALYVARQLVKHLGLTPEEVFQP